MKKILQLISFILILFVSNNAVTKELPANIHNVVPEFAVKEKTFKKYTVEGDTFRGMFLPGNAALGSYAVGIALGLIEKKDYKFFIGTSSGAIGTIFLYANDKKEVAKFTRGLDSDKILSNNIKFLSLLFGKSFAENKPLKDYVYKNITNKIIDKMANRYKKGYRGFVASTNINTGQNVIWDLGAIASSKKYDYDYKREMFAKIIVASAALPGIFPPSTFNVTYKNKQYTQTHVDGGLGFTVVLKKWLLPSNLDSISKKSFYIVQTDEYVSKNPSTVDLKIPTILIQSVGISYSATYKASKQQIYHFGEKYNIKTYVNIIPKKAPLNFSSFDFSKKNITPAFNAGLKSVRDKKLQWKVLTAK